MVAHALPSALEFQNCQSWRTCLIASGVSPTFFSTSSSYLTTQIARFLVVMNPYKETHMKKKIKTETDEWLVSHDDFSHFLGKHRDRVYEHLVSLI